jgi:spermidine synthase
MSEVTPHQPHSRGFLVFLFLTSLVCGGLVMVVEVLGSRVIGPFFGASLFVWTSLITVTLLGLSLGYFTGGIMADRRDSPGYLYGIILVAGVAVLLVPALKKPVLDLTVNLGLRVGALAASTLLFGPALFLLGCVSPYIVKIAAREIRNIGRTVGLFSAVSTVGSFFGTIGTGFFLIAFFRVNQIFLTIGASLVALAVLYFILFGRTRSAVLLLAVPFLIPGGPDVRSKLLPNGTTVTKVYDADSFYGNIKVLDRSFGDVHTRELLVDGVVQGGIDIANGMSVFDYYYYLQYIPYTLNPGGRNCLVIGLGPGTIPRWYEGMGIRTDVVDISPEVFSVAERFFGFQNSGVKIVADARYFLNCSTKRYDFVILDVFNGENTPVHVLSLESLRLVARCMNPGAVLGINTIGSLSRESYMTMSVVKTLRQVFSTVQVFPTFDPAGNEWLGNVEIVAYNGPPRSVDRAQLRDFPFHPLAATAQARIGALFTPPPDAPGMILTDNYNPVDFYDLPVKEEVRRRINAYTDREMLL